ncbi:MAG TPA: MauE/DoxX family redox-associated membrane protein [Chloroflexia bacterium]|nr:MauE/DoxX family redox-associated membrane protein [Chloroflexia bacterium]
MIRRVLTNPYLTLVSRLVLGGIFFLAGLTKLGVPAAFRASINSYEMPLPAELVQAMAVWLPPLELGVGLWILVGLFTRFAAALSSGLMIVFLVALVQAMARGLSPDCGCFSGPDGNPIGLAVLNALGPVGSFLTTGQVGPATIIRDLTFLAMGVHLMVVPTVFGIDNLRRRGTVETADAGVEEPAAQPAPEMVSSEIRL